MAYLTDQPMMSGEQDDRRQRNVAYLLAFIGAGLALLTVVELLQRLTAGAGIDYVPFARLGVVAAFLVAARMVYGGDVVRGLSLALVAALAVCVLVLINESGQAPFWAGVFYFLFAGLIIYIIPEQQVGAALVLVTLATLTLILMDAFWPYPRVSTQVTNFALRIPLAAILMVLVAGLIIRNFTQFNLGNKLIIALLAVSLLPMGLLALINLIVTRDALIEDANRVLLVAATQTTSDIDNFIRNELANTIDNARLLDLTEAAALVQGGAVDETDREDILRHLKALRDADPLNIQSVALLDQTGRVVMDTLASNEGRDESGRLYFVNAIDSNQPYISPVEFPAGATEPVLTFSAPVQDAEGNTVGVLRTTYKAIVLQNLVTQNTGLVGGESFGVLFDENQIHLAHGRAPGTLYKTVDTLLAEAVVALQEMDRLPAGTPDTLSTQLPVLSENLAEAARNPFFTAQDVPTDERINRVAVIPLNTQPWSVGYFQPEELFLTPVEALNRATVLVGVVIAGLITIFAIAASRFLIQPIEKLTTAASQIAGGDLSARADVMTGDEIGVLATTFNMMTGRLETTLSGLEERVASRTRALETSAQVSRSVSTILDPEDLVRAVARQVHEAFDYYHVQIYQYQKEQERLLLVAGYGREGESAAIGRHSLNLGEGLVGRAAFRNAPVLEPDTAASADWVYNPQLPETKSEVAVPIRIGEEVLGVLDVQQDRVEGLQQDDVDVLQTFANQVAVALRNAGLYANIREQAEREMRINEITHRIQATTDIEQALQVAARELGRATGSDRVMIRLRRDENGHSRE